MNAPLSKQAFSRSALRLVCVLPTIVALLFMFGNAGAGLITHDHAAHQEEDACTGHHHQHEPHQHEHQPATETSDDCEQHTHYVSCSCPKVPADHSTYVIVFLMPSLADNANWTDYASNFAEEPFRDIFQPPKV